MITYYFPIDKIQAASNISIYGLGTIGKELIAWNERYHYCNVLCIIDKIANENVTEYSGIPVVPIDRFSNSRDVDYILLSSKQYETEMICGLKNVLVDENKIVKLDYAVISGNIEESVENASSLGEADYWGKNGIAWYQRAEDSVQQTYDLTIGPIIEKYPFLKQKNNWLDFGCGEGRITSFLKEDIKKIYCCDINERAIEYCKRRFQGNSNIVCFVNTHDKISLENESIDVVFSVGTMVHFSLREMNFYLKEMYRILVKGGWCLIHHSNWRDTADYFSSQNAHSDGYYRGDVSSDDIKRIAEKYGFEIVEQHKIPWGIVEEKIDCISVLKK